MTSSDQTSAAVRMHDVINRHLERGERGWLAIRIADGSSDGVLYCGSIEAELATLPHLEAFAFFPISPLCPWTLHECAEFLEFMTHLRHGCMVYGRPTCC
ncbi:hypothetical protein OG330_30970 (plasmid) [Streptomyces albidoflavus]|uniref:hypothetical protein n=1 Tax=Streptomyces albidoflavus TaxID=1886 RepID=UPI00226F18B6|nr:hypothetical protein [Streptomyces albidoflavus]WSU19597.1 hypothetical protein OG330_30970 [Streptomyces albidoflavus]CAI4198568.1 hypothetical protein CCOS2040_31175 [Streptomyces albidoflavus]